MVLICDFGISQEITLHSLFSPKFKHFFNMKNYVFSQILMNATKVAMIVWRMHTASTHLVALTVNVSQVLQEMVVPGVKVNLVNNSLHIGFLMRLICFHQLNAFNIFCTNMSEDFLVETRKTTIMFLPEENSGFFYHLKINMDKQLFIITSL